jgi:methyl-accepting chemotaxis protein
MTFKIRLRGIQIKILGVVALGILAVVITSAMSLRTLQNAMLEDRKQELQAATGVLHSQIGVIKTRLDHGDIGEAEAKAQLVNLIHSARYNGTAYFGVYNLAGIMVAHGTTPAFDGADMLHHENPAVRNSTKAMLDLSTGGKSGFLMLLGTKSGHPDINVEKLYYAASFAPWGLVTVSSSELDDIQTAFWQEASKIGLIGLAVSIVLGAAGWWIGHNVSKAVGSLDGKMRHLAEGRLDVELSEASRHDEIGTMARSVAFFRDKLIEAERLRDEREASKRQADAEKRQAMANLAEGFEHSVGKVMNAVTSKATDMEDKIHDLSQAAEQSEQMAAAVSAATEQTSANVQTVASASEQLAASIDEIGRQVATSSQVADEAVSLAERANQKVSGLAEAVERIGAVVDLINSIASQTNLLALNATIEAARAGESGKGFAVVASEVKALATQTARATEEIASQIGTIQTVTGEAVNEIGGVSGVIGRVREIATAISAAVEEQGAATKEISRNVQQAAAGAHDVATNIAGVNTAAIRSGQLAGAVMATSRELGGNIGSLNSEVDGFLKMVRSS